MTDSYVLQLKQCVQFLGYNKGHVLEHFKNIFPQDIIFLVFKIYEAAESAKHVMTKDELNIPLAG